MDLASLISETQTQQAQQLVEFKGFFKQSLQLKDASQVDDQSASDYVFKVFESYMNGEAYQAEPTTNSQLNEMWSILSENKDYSQLLKRVMLPSIGTADDRIELIKQYIDEKLATFE